jgi:hypothetical protein
VASFWFSSFRPWPDMSVRQGHDRLLLQRAPSTLTREGALIADKKGQRIQAALAHGLINSVKISSSSKEGLLWLPKRRPPILA